MGIKRFLSKTQSAILNASCQFLILPDTFETAKRNDRLLWIN
tara:strand:+ start:420 stop:545 length:126 start_codon:yes stop_codon:yes gene_type:complete